MKDSKLYKVLRIIFLTLAIISLVFTLCKKVGLCASIEPPSYVSDYPLICGPDSHYGYSSFPLTSDLFFGCVDYVLNNDQYNRLDSGWICLIYEETSQYIIFEFLGDDDLSSVSSTFDTYSHIEFNNWYGHIRVKLFLDGSCSIMGSYSNSSFSCNFGSKLVNSPTGGKYFPTDTYCLYYPVAWSDNFDVNYNNIVVLSYPPDSGLHFSDGSVTSLPSFDSLTGIPNSSDTQDSLFDKLKGWLSTIQGNIQKGFKNIEENLTSFFKPYLDNIKAFYEWVTEPFDSESASDSLEAIQAISDIRALNNIIGTAGIFNWSDVSPASRVAFTFDFGGAVLPHHQYEVNFDWYTGNVKTLILSILVTFLVVGLLVTIINNIPSMIHGHSGDSGGGSN